MSKKYYISDLHFGHFNILAYDKRPFFSIEEMDSELVDNWNNTVSNEDEVYILGDISWYNKEKTLDILKKLKGIKYLIRGNHDTNFTNSNKESQGFRWIKDYAEIKDGDKKVILSHYPIPCYKGNYNNYYHLFGHVHNTKESDIIESCIDAVYNCHSLERKAYNVGCMKHWMQYEPKTLEQIINGYNSYIELIKKLKERTL